jgi:hypothetical protein
VIFVHHNILPNIILLILVRCVIELGDSGLTPDKPSFSSPDSNTSSPQVLKQMSSTGVTGAGEGLHTVHEGDDHSVDSLDKAKPSLLVLTNDKDDLGFDSGDDDDIFGAETPRSLAQPSPSSPGFSDFNGMTKSRLSLRDFTKQISENDLKSLNRRTKENDMSDEEKSEASVDLEIELSEEQLGELR